MFCSNCGKEVSDKAVICVHCGCALKNTSITSESEKTFSAALLLCLFLGGLGAHRFYTGHTGSAVVMLILTLTMFGAIISGPWALVDLIRICTGSFKTASGESLKK